LMHFGTKFYENLGVPKEEVTTRLGLLVVLGGITGGVVGGLLGDWLGKKDPGAYSLLAGIGYLIGFPATIAGLHLAPHPASYFVLALAFTMFFMCLPLVNTQIANVVPANQRALAYASAVFILHILGDTISPPLFGLVSSQLGANGRLIAFTIFPFSLLFSSACCLAAWRYAQTEAAKT
jgi:MFS family permease